MYTHMYAKKGKGGGDAGAEADFIGEGRSYTIALKCSKNHTFTISLAEGYHLQLLNDRQTTYMYIAVLIPSSLFDILRDLVFL